MHHIQYYGAVGHGPILYFKGFVFVDHDKNRITQGDLVTFAQLSLLDWNVVNERSVKTVEISNHQFMFISGNRTMTPGNGATIHANSVRSITSNRNLHSRQRCGAPIQRSGQSDELTVH